MRERKPKKSVKQYKKQIKQPQKKVKSRLKPSARTYRTYQFYEQAVREQLKDVSKEMEYLRIKSKYGLGTTTTKSMLYQGFTKIDLRKYWKREYQIITGQYEEIRDRQFIKNYISQLKNQGVDEELIEDFKKASRLKKNRKYLISRVPDFAFWGYAKNQKQKQISEEELEENIADLENVLKNLRENPIKIIK